MAVIIYTAKVCQNTVIELETVQAKLNALCADLHNPPGGPQLLSAIGISSAYEAITLQTDHAAQQLNRFLDILTAYQGRMEAHQRAKAPTLAALDFSGGLQAAALASGYNETDSTDTRTETFVADRASMGFEGSFDKGTPWLADLFGMLIADALSGESFKALSTSPATKTEEERRKDALKRIEKGFVGTKMPNLDKLSTKELEDLADWVDKGVRFTSKSEKKSGEKETDNGKTGEWSADAVQNVLESLNRTKAAFVAKYGEKIGLEKLYNGLGLGSGNTLMFNMYIPNSNWAANVPGEGNTVNVSPYEFVDKKKEDEYLIGTLIHEFGHVMDKNIGKKLGLPGWWSYEGAVVEPISTFPFFRVVPKAWTEKAGWTKVEITVKDKDGKDVKQSIWVLKDITGKPILTSDPDREKRLNDIGASSHYATQGPHEDFAETFEYWVEVQNGRTGGKTSSRTDIGKPNKERQDLLVRAIELL